MVYRNPANTDGTRPCVPLDSIMTDRIVRVASGPDTLLRITSDASRVNPCVLNQSDSPRRDLSNGVSESCKHGRQAALCAPGLHHDGQDCPSRIIQVVPVRSRRRFVSFTLQEYNKKNSKTDCELSKANGMIRTHLTGVQQADCFAFHRFRSGAVI